MSYTMPETGSRWHRKSDGALVEVLGCTGSNWCANVTLRRVRDNATNRRWGVRLENLWRKYEPAESLKEGRDHDAQL